MLALFCLGAASAAAQTVSWDPPGGQLGFNQVSQLSLVFENCEPDLGQLKLPAVDGLAFGRPSQSSETNMVNFKVTRRFSLVYPVRPAKRTTLTIPEFTVATDQGVQRVRAASYTVGDATVGGTGLALDDISSASLSVPKHTFWAGEVIPVTYTLSVVKRYFHSLASTVEWPSAPLVASEWTKPEPSETMERGERRIVATQTTQAYSKQPGTFSLKPASQQVNLIVGRTNFGLFSSPAVEQQILSTDPLEVNIQPLPSAPAGFSGAVGQFSLVSKVVPTAPAVGEPVTWTLELAGTGNWPDISGLPARDVSNDFQVIQPKSKRTMKDNSLFEGRLAEDVVLVPSKAGSYTLGPVKLVYFDTAAGEYKTLTTQPATITVSAAGTQSRPATPGAPVQFSLNLPPGRAMPPPAVATAKPPVPPENLPRDPLPAGGGGMAPFGVPALFGLCAAGAIALPAFAWLFLAAQRSRLTDPERPRRDARAKLIGAVASLRGPERAIRQPLRLWQQQTAVLWKIPHAAPNGSLVQASVATWSATAAPTWAALWAEAEQALHGRTGELPKNWAARAESALQAVNIPGWAPGSLFARHNLLPFLAATGRTRPDGVPGGARLAMVSLGFFLLVVLDAPTPLTAAEAGAEAYAKGDFPAAEKAWQTAAATAPADWTLRHDVGLALAQQDRWPEATAAWAGAFLLAPRAAETQWDLALGLQRSGLAPTELVELSRGHGRYGLARLASPGEWQAGLVVASLCIAAALVMLLLRGYSRIGRWARPAALATILLAILLAGCATASLRTYGALAHPEVALVWKSGLLRSIPTEVDNSQKTSPLAAGSIAIVDKTFPGPWSRLDFAGGQTGWVRSEDLVKLYR